MALERRTLQLLDSFGRWGSAPGEFGTLHHMGADSKGNLYVTEVTPLKPENRRFRSSCSWDDDGATWVSSRPRTRFSIRSARAGWAKSIALAIRASTGSWQSRFSLSGWRTTRKHASGSSARHGRSHKSITRTSAPCTTSAVRRGVDYLVFEHLEGETLAHRISQRVHQRDAADREYQVLQENPALIVAHRSSFYDALRPGGVR